MTFTADPRVDYALVIEELSTLNRLYARTDANPLLDPKRFLTVESNQTFKVIQSLNTGMYYMSDTIKDSFGHTTHKNFALAEPHKRTVTDWVWV